MTPIPGLSAFVSLPYIPPWREPLVALPPSSENIGNCQRCYVDSSEG